ncbi:BTAD domain-containing putative transcriptional regulator [Streptomyces albiaxialis]|uniref:BTAD domain-containing putative transcriptional regulator n=1 Tax=Streptomyces albiaxialis TaxID=329523 RepID=A0ABP5HV52_9ACTN
MDFEIVILGPIGIRARGHHDALGSAKERALLAALAVDAGRSVPLDALTQRLWDDDPPGKPRASLHSYAARLRRRLRDATGGERLVQQAHTYCLDVAPESVDSFRFQRLTERARTAASGDEARTLGAFREAEALWRGEALAGLTGSWPENVRMRLESQRFAAQLDRAALELRMGHFTGLVAELSSLLEQQPTDETLTGQLMVAHYGSGRQAEALRLFETLRQRLKKELGTDPGTPLRRIHHLILQQEPVERILDPSKPRAAHVTAGEGKKPNNIPAHGDLVGREAELRTLQELPQGAVITLQSISGMGGVGKTLLAFHVGRRLSPRFPSGQIYLDLRAHSAGRKPLTPSAALTSLLRAMGFSPKALPRGLDELTSLWRNTLSTRQAIVILDDAASDEQVRPLLVQDCPSLFIITSRNRLGHLPGARSVLLDVLPLEDATALFTGLIGPARSRNTDPDDVARIVESCGRLPLAIELAAGRLNSRPAWTVRYLGEKIARSKQRLGEIRDGQREIHHVFSLSYRTLTEQQRSAFRRLGLHWGATFTSHTAAALIDEPLDQTERHIDALLDSHLLQEPEPERYRFHDLLGEYALTLVRDTPGEPEAALRRQADFSLACAARADALAHPRRPRFPLEHAAVARELPQWTEAREAKAWFRAEAGALICAEHYARAHGLPGPAAELAHALASFLDTEGLWHEAAVMHGHAADHWRSGGARRAETLARIDLSIAEAHAGQYAQAAASGQQALALARSLDDPDSTAEALHQLGILHWHRGEYPVMRELLQEALDIRTRSGDTWGQARSTNTLGIAHLHLGDPVAASRHFRDALSSFRESGDMRGVCQSLNNLAETQVHIGELDSARESFSRVLEISIESGSRSEQAMARLNLANTYRIPEELESALELYGMALTSFQHLGDRRDETITLISIGNALQRAARYEESLARHSSALDLARSLGAGLEEAQALRGIGSAEHRLGRLDMSEQHLTEAITLASRIQSPEEEARACDALAELKWDAMRIDVAYSLWQRALGIFKKFDRSESERIEGRLRGVAQTY